MKRPESQKGGQADADPAFFQPVQPEQATGQKMFIFHLPLAQALVSFLTGPPVKG